MRHRLLEPIRQYAAELLDSDTGAAVWRDRYQTYYLELAEQAAPMLRGPDHDRWRQRPADEHDNLRAALRWCLHSGEVAASLRLCSALGLFWEQRALLSEGLSWLDRALKRADEGVAPELRARALAASASGGALPRHHLPGQGLSHTLYQRERCTRGSRGNTAVYIDSITL